MTFICPFICPHPTFAQSHVAALLAGSGGPEDLEQASIHRSLAGAPQSRSAGPPRGKMRSSGPTVWVVVAAGVHAETHRGAGSAVVRRMWRLSVAGCPLPSIQSACASPLPRIWLGASPCGGAHGAMGRRSLLLAPYSQKALDAGKRPRSLDVVGHARALLSIRSVSPPFSACTVDALGGGMLGTVAANGPPPIAHVQPTSTQGDRVQNPDVQHGSLSTTPRPTTRDPHPHSPPTHPLAPCHRSSSTCARRLIAFDANRQPPLSSSPANISRPSWPSANVLPLFASAPSVVRIMHPGHRLSQQWRRVFRSG